MRVIGTICARGGSKGVPGKNKRLLSGKPLIAHTVEQALASPVINAGVFVSTDDPEIAEIARQFGATVPVMRPAELATDSAAKLPVIEHLVCAVEASSGAVDVVVDLDPTSPLRSLADIDAAMSMLVEPFDLVVSVTPARKNPYFNMVEQLADGSFGISKALDPPPIRRQDAPDVYEINGSIYVYRRETIPHGLWAGRMMVYPMPMERSADIDAEADFQYVEYIMRARESAETQ